MQFLGERTTWKTAGHVGIGEECGADRREECATVILHKIPSRDCCVRTGEKHTQRLHFLKNSFVVIMWSATSKARSTRPLPTPPPSGEDNG